MKGPYFNRLVPSEAARDVAPPVLATAAWNTLAALARRSGVGEDVLLATALQALLYRYTRGDADLTIRMGLGRDLPVCVAGERSFAQALSAAAAVPASLGRRHLGMGAPLSLSWSEEPAAAAGAEACGLSVGAAITLEPDGLRTHFVVAPPAGGASLAWQAPRLATHWQTLLAGLAANADLPLREAQILDTAELALLTGVLSGAEVRALAPSAANLVELFERQARRRPDQLAVICDGIELTYDELDRRASQVAGHLRARGVGRGDRVGLYMPRSADAFVGMIGILKAGAAYVPIDPDYPEERVAYILDNAGAPAVLTSASLASRAARPGLAVVRLDADWTEIAQQPETLGQRCPAGPEDLAYVIYTSGSTGKPKGVMIENRHALAFLKADGVYYGVHPDDRVYQGFSLAFDASVEEVWLAFQAGATLVAATAAVARSGPELATFLNEHRITVYSTVPTALMMIDDPLPLVRILILGGEECTAELVRRFHRPDRRLVNSYGPTEATVVVTAADTTPGRKVTIGRPLAGVRVYVLDEMLRPVPFGLSGELCLAGPTVARGYLGLGDLTAERFVPVPAVLGGAPGERLYRTGDLVRFAADGELEFLGRIDSQVKLRGYRIELGEIEARLAAEPGVRNAAVMLREDTPGLKQLVAYVVPLPDRAPEPAALRAAMRHRLPSYMVPSHIELLAELPSLPSGKVDKKRLPPPTARPAAAPEFRGRPPETPVEAEVLALWQRLFHPEPVGMDDDFFALGGHSLLATRLLSELRRNPRHAEASVLDIYQHPTLAAFARHLESRGGGAKPAGEAERPAYRPVAKGAFARCVGLQALGLYVAFAVFALNWLIPVVGFDYYVRHPGSIPMLFGVAVLLGYALIPLHILVSIAVKWVVIGRFKAGSYPLWSLYYWRFWLAKRAMPLFTPYYLRGTPFLAPYYRLLGAKIGRSVHLGTAGFVVMDQLTIGDGASIGVDAQLTGYAYRGGMLHIGPVTISAGAVVGARSVVDIHTELGANAELGAHSLMPEGMRIGAGEHWQGSPARPLPGPPPAAPTADLRGRELGPLAYTLAFLAMILALTIVPMMALVPGLALWALVAMRHGFYWSLITAPIDVALFVVAWCASVCLAKKLLVGKVTPGSYRVHSWYGIRRWCVDELIDASLEAVFPLYATLYLKPFLTSLGAKVGRLAEISTAGHFQPDLVELGDGSFMADAVCMGPTRVAHGIGTSGPVVVGKNAFVGNGACLPEGTVLGEGSLIGCQSRPAMNLSAVAAANTSWIGSPGVLLPRRAVAPGFEERYTFKPTARLYATRLAIEFWRITLPETIGFVLSAAFIRAVLPLYESWTLAQFLAVFPVLVFGICAVAALSVVALKWLIVGRYRPGARPLWSDFVWRTELVDALHEQLAAGMFLNLVRGTPLLPLYFRLLGARIGKRALMETVNITEFDLVTMGDDVCLDNECDLQTHLFEDRVMKMSTVVVGDKCSVGPSTVVLYDSVLGEGASISGMSLLMKGESLQPWTRWEGAPLVQARRPSLLPAFGALIPAAGATS